MKKVEKTWVLFVIIMISIFLTVNLIIIVQNWGDVFIVLYNVLIVSTVFLTIGTPINFGFLIVCCKLNQKGNSNGKTLES